MAKSNTTAGEGILNQTIALVEKLRTERDDALIEARDMQLRLTCVVEGGKSILEERDAAHALLSHLISSIDWQEIDLTLRGDWDNSERDAVLAWLRQTVDRLRQWQFDYQKYSRE